MKLFPFLAAFLFILYSSTTTIAGTDSIDEILNNEYAVRGVEGPIKCGTVDLLRILNSATANGHAMKAAIAASTRPVMQSFVDSPSGRFRIHYDLSGFNAPDLSDLDLNAVPDYVDSTAFYLDYAWELIIDELGYAAPMGDGLRGGEPSGMIDCYIKELGFKYGVAIPDNSSGKTSARMEIDNDFIGFNFNTSGYDALKVTTAHEFFHVVQYSYHGASKASLWWMEHTAVWIEDRAWDNVNDYIHWLEPLFSKRNVPINDGGSFYYAASMFAFHIAEEYGDGMIRSLWNKFRETQSGNILNFNTVLPEGVAKTLSDLAVWLYFTGERSNTAFFRDSDIIFSSLEIEKQLTTYSGDGSLTLKNHTFKYIEIEPEDGFVSGDTLKVAFTESNGGNWKKQVIFYNTPYDYSIQPLNGEKASAYLNKSYKKAILVIANSATLGRDYDLVYSYETVETTPVNKRPQPYSFAIQTAYPNPFNAATTIPFTLDAEGQARLTVHNLQGAVVAELVDTVLPAGTHSAAFDASGMASGIYFASLISKGRRETAKLLYLK